MTKDKFIGTVELHIKYCGDWLCATSKDSVREDHLGHAINLLALQTERQIEKLLSGKIDIDELPTKKSDGKNLAIVIPTKEEENEDDHLR